MKLTKTRLKQIIKEEIQHILDEGEVIQGDFPEPKTDQQEKWRKILLNALEETSEGEYNFGTDENITLNIFNARFYKIYDELKAKVNTELRRLQKAGKLNIHDPVAWGNARDTEIIKHGKEFLRTGRKKWSLLPRRRPTEGVKP